MWLCVLVYVNVRVLFEIVIRVYMCCVHVWVFCAWLHVHVCGCMEIVCDRRGGYLFVCDGFCTSESEGISVLFCVHCLLQVLAVS